MIAALLALPCLTPAQAAPLDWLAGAWTHTRAEVTIEERWSPAAAGHLLGTNRTLKGGTQVGWEFLRVAPIADRLVYFAAPDGRHPPTPFCLAKSGPAAATFVNATHDFPKRIDYQRDGATLRVRISGDGRSINFVFQRATGP